MLNETFSVIFKYRFCRKGFKQSSNLTTLTWTHTGSKSFKCDLSKKSFNRSDNLSSHIRSQNCVKRYRCDICGTEFARSDHLSDHVLSQHIYLWIIALFCNFCSKYNLIFTICAYESFFVKLCIVRQDNFCWK